MPAMPSKPWSGYGRFCPLSRALDVIGERWTLVIVQELLKQPRPPGAAPGAELIVRTSWASLDRWPAGEAGWDDGRPRGEVTVEGPPAAWPRWLAATGYLLQVEPDTAQETVMEEGSAGDV